MTWSWSLPVRIAPSTPMSAPPLEPTRTRAVIPTFRDWRQAKASVESLLNCRPHVGEIVVVSDNASGHVPGWARSYPIQVLGYGANRGPSFARNFGAHFKSQHPIEWLLFTDTGCERDPNYFESLVAASGAQGTSCVAIAGPVHGVVSSKDATPINCYMTEEGILNPPILDGMPQSIITANAAVSIAAFRAVGGFDTSYPFAAGEDLDLGLKLLRLGRIGWAPKALVRHRFLESLCDFRRRFERYGEGNAHLEQTWSLPCIRPLRFSAHDPAMQWLAGEQICAMQRGYDRYRREGPRARSAQFHCASPPGLAG
jgi:GT2 family glycosyltransferase